MKINTILANTLISRAAEIEDQFGRNFIDMFPDLNYSITSAIEFNDRALMLEYIKVLDELV